jgi:hypothetical protein
MPTQVNPEDFSSRWEYSKATSEWHFDKLRNEDEARPFTVLGRFKEGAWQREIEEVLKTAPMRPVSFVTRIAGRFRDKAPYTLRMDEHDMNKMGLPVDHVLYRIVELPTPRFGCRMANFPARGRDRDAACQYPSETFPFHIDDLTSSKRNNPNHPLNLNPDLLVRLEIQLLDWEWGHVWAYGNTYWKQWRAGEIAFHKWRDVPHGTANCGHTPRCVLQLSGRVTPFTRELLGQRNLVIDLGRLSDPRPPTATPIRTRWKPDTPRTPARPLRLSCDKGGIPRPAFSTPLARPDELIP